MERRKVLVLKKECLLNEAVQSLLSQQEDLLVLAEAVASDEEMIQVIDAFRPDTIVLDEGTLKQNAKALAISFETYPALRTVIVRMGDNTIEICDKKTVTIKRSEDFIAAIRPLEGEGDRR